MTDAPADTSVLGRMIAAGINPEKAERLILAGAITVDGELVTDPAQPAPQPARITERPT